ncbi:GrpB family protein [uncultured Tateyamaria sp.]|uniref:GrpB family protein n=1 Tax=Tateyamaria sp. 1078 TaxID=3417464 RepID=UPI00260B3FAC|nr:GrpB family protein [uncultured Tateyamaria sp.]
MTSGKDILGLKQGTLSLMDHAPQWADLYRREAMEIAQAVAGVPYALEHIGSTSVPGLAAKPILDIAMQARHSEQVARALVQLGYLDRGERSGRLFIRLRAGDVRTHNLHLYPCGDAAFAEQVAFRDALRADPDLRERYSELKHTLVRALGDGGRADYADRKTQFVTAALRANQS